MYHNMQEKHLLRDMKIKNVILWGILIIILAAFLLEANALFKHRITTERIEHGKVVDRKDSTLPN